MNVRSIAVLAASVLLLALPTSCRMAPRWNGGVETFGSMGEVLRDGKTETRVFVASVTGREHAFGVGALEGLTGEVTILDGEVWVTRAVSAKEIETARNAEQDAALLLVAYVPEWTEKTVERDIPAWDFDAFIRECGVDAGLDPEEPFPFTVEGELTSLDMHVIAGECPMRAKLLGQEMESPPYRFASEQISGKIVGFYADDAVGEITHHGSRTHAHVLLESETPATGHVEAVGFKAGARVRVPAR